MSNDFEMATLINENLKEIFNAINRGEIPSDFTPNETINTLFRLKDQLRSKAMQAKAR